MTDTPNLSALAMRTRAAALLEGEVRDEPMSYYAHAILALPLEADPAALVAEALRLPKVRALWDAAKGVNHDSLHGNGLEGFRKNRDRLRIVIDQIEAALVQP